MHHGPPHDLGWIALGPSRRFALDDWRPQRRMGARPDDPEGSDVWDRMACGRSRIAAPGRLTPSMQTGHHGLMRGLAGEWFRGDRTFGASIGPNHVAAFARFNKRRRVARPRRLDVEGEPKGWGVRGVCGGSSPRSRGLWPWSWPDRTVLGHASVRRAWGDTWLLQATGRGRWVFHEPDASHLASLYSMACRPRQGGVPFQMRLSLDNRTAMLEARVQPKPDGAWRLAPQGRMFNVGASPARMGSSRNHRSAALKGVAVARHVKMTHRMEGPRRVILGMVWMEGAGVGALQRAVLPWADRMTWMQTPLEGARASIWVGME